MCWTESGCDEAEGGGCERGSVRSVSVVLDGNKVGGSPYIQHTTQATLRYNFVAGKRNAGRVQYRTVSDELLGLTLPYEAHFWKGRQVASCERTRLQGCTSAEARVLRRAVSRVQYGTDHLTEALCDLYRRVNGVRLLTTPKCTATGGQAREVVVPQRLRLGNALVVVVVRRGCSGTTRTTFPERIHSARRAHWAAHSLLRAFGGGEEGRACVSPHVRRGVEINKKKPAPRETNSPPRPVPLSSPLPSPPPVALANYLAPTLPWACLASLSAACRIVGELGAAIPPPPTHLSALATTSFFPRPFPCLARLPLCPRPSRPFLLPHGQKDHPA